MALDPIQKALDDALVAIITARSVLQAQKAARAAEVDGKCAHRDKVEMTTFGEGTSWLCPDCGEQWDD